MFTGIIKAKATIKSIARRNCNQRLKLQTDAIDFTDLGIDESVAINGVCLTVVQTKPSEKEFEVDVVEETLNKTTIRLWTINQEVNLERALRLQDRLGGHYVLGHVDTMGEVTAIKKNEDSLELHIVLDKNYLPFLVPVGSIAIDGVSLTVAEIEKEGFKVAIIPYTLKHTTLKNLRVNDKVNLEFDVLGKYVKKFIKPYRNSTKNSRF